MQEHSIGKESSVRPNLKKIQQIILVLLGVYLFIRHLLPLLLPFLLGAALALAAEPAVAFCCSRLKLPRAAASGIGITMTFVLLALVIVLLCALAVRELQTLAGILPDLEEAALAGMDSLSHWLMDLARKAPSGLRNLAARQVSGFFSGGTALLEKGVSWLLNFARGILSRATGSALTVITAIISSFMISAKLPRLRAFFRSRLPREQLQSALSALSRMKSVVGGWLKAQLKLWGVTFSLCAAGLLLLRVSHGLLWALLVALVDIFPILGVGTALIPWSLAAFLQGDRFLAFGLLGLYAVCAVTRSVLEPRLLGKQLGLDPLVTLIAVYAGYRLWGFAGMILTPMLAVTAKQILRPDDSAA